MGDHKDSNGSAERRVWQLSVVMALGAVALAALHWEFQPTDLTWPSVVCLALIPAFMLAEIVVIHLPAQRSSHSHTLRELPAIAGLTFLPFGEYLLAYIVGGGLALLLWSHQRGLKLVFNVSMFSLEAALGVTVYTLVLSGGDPISPVAWAAALAAVLVTDLISATAVTAAISLTEGRLDREVMGEALRSGVPAAVVNTCVALLFVTLVVASPSSLPLLGAIVVLLVLGYRVYVSLARGYAQTQQLYEFVEVTSRSAEIEDVIPAILAESARLLKANRAQMAVLTQTPGSFRLVTWEEGERHDEEVPHLQELEGAWWGSALTGPPVLMTGDSGAGSEAAPGDVRNGIAVAMRDDTEIVGVLHVSNRSFDEETFGQEDLRLFEALAAHATVALSKARAIERLKRVAEEREFEAMHDPLTGLPNRRAFTQAVEAAMAQGQGGAVLLLDLDDFKDVNDTLGHTAGDALLRVTGARLDQESPGLVARLGGDEFAVLLCEGGVDAAVEIAQRLRAAVTVPVSLSDVDLITSASFGVAALAGTAKSSDDLLAQADVAMYAAKEARTGVESYRAADGVAIERRLVLAADLGVALERGELELWFQPQAQLSDGAVSGFEALLRWSHPQFGWVPPPEVVAVAQRTGLVRTLTDYILDQALTSRMAWHGAGFDLEVAVNVTPRDIADLTLVRRVEQALLKTGVPASDLVIEVTESDALGDPERSMTVLNGLAALGVRLSVDDFGTGYSSLAYLERLPVHEVKIDQSFVFRLERDASDSTIVRATVNLAHDLGLRVVAEGVESEVSRLLVADLGCDVYQGYGLSRPIAAAGVLPWLQAMTGRQSEHPRRTDLALVEPQHGIVAR